MCASFNKSIERLLSEVFSFSAFVWYLKCLMSFLRKPVNPDLSRYNEFEWVARKVSHHAVFFPPMTDFCEITEIFLRFYLTETAKFIWESKASKLKQNKMKQDYAIQIFCYFLAPKKLSSSEDVPVPSSKSHTGSGWHSKRILATMLALYYWTRS